MSESPDFLLDKEFNQEKIQFHFEEVNYNISNQAILLSWIESTIEKENQQLRHLNFIFCSDAYLHKINLEYLNHDTLTDIITFPYAKDIIEGDIFISIDRVKENAKKFKVSTETELQRVIIHGVLHLCGFLDKTSEEKSVMTQKENEHLTYLNGMILDK